MEEILFTYRFVSGHFTINGQYSLFNPIWYKGILTVKITEKRIIITSFGIKIWKILFSEIFLIQIKPKILGASVNITSKDRNGFLFIINDIGGLVEKLKEVNLPVLYDNKSIKEESKRFKIASNPIVLFIVSILGITFIAFIVFNILH